MRIVLFDGILETHLHESLERSLLRRGHQVLATGKIGHGFKFPHPVSERLNLERAVSEAIAFDPDWVFVFRPASLPPHLLARLKKRGIGTVAWFSDDPVLFDLSYGPVLEQYDKILHCGNEAVLQHYEDFFGYPTGVNFPFWTDQEAFPYVWSSEPTESDVMFLGNVQDEVRRRRYFDLSQFGDDIRIHGKIGSDYWNRSAGYLDTDAEVVAAGARTRWAVNIPQFFKDHRGLETWFDGLDRLGFFEYPSRVVQYMSMGIPTISIVPDLATFETYPEMLVCDNIEEALRIVRSGEWDGHALEDLSRKVASRFTRHFSADARVSALESFLVDDTWTTLSASDRTRWFTNFDGTAIEAVDVTSRESEGERVPTITVAARRDVVVVADEELRPTDRPNVLRDAFESMGWPVTLLRTAGANELDSPVSADSIAANALLFVCVDNMKLSRKLSQSLRASGITSVFVADGPREVNRASAALFQNYDFIAFSDPRAQEAFRDAGFDQAHFLPHFVSPKFALAVKDVLRDSQQTLRVAPSANVEEAMSSGLSIELAAAGIELETWNQLRELDLHSLAQRAAVSASFLSPEGVRSSPRFDSLFHHVWFAGERVFIPRLADLVHYPQLSAASVIVGDAGEVGRKAWRLLDSPGWASSITASADDARRWLDGESAILRFLSRLLTAPSVSEDVLSSASGLLEEGSARTWKFEELSQGEHSAQISISARERYFAEPMLEVRVRVDGKSVWQSRMSEQISIAVAVRDSIALSRVDLQVRYVGRTRNISVTGSHEILAKSTGLSSSRPRSGHDVTVLQVVRPAIAQPA